ncbi:MAG TPA: tyrosine recombinase XerC [Pseudomonadales bacterium]|mgnify:FL=1|jgi:integrase/recombinase XerC|nr:tyrosine recombinase XerC [Pseudomonadales bacterium]HNL92363.1 tyrosine recombinase XerC [Pseudomonadales bacterium]HNN86553.1 tyrosine recombinase XerC [Pseudomonadales bacterium]
MQADIEQYLQYLAGERRLSPHTLSAYRRDLVLLQTQAQQQAISDVAQWREFHIRQLVATLHHRGLSGRSLQRLLSAWRQFFAWLGRQRRVDSNPVGAVRAPKSGRKLPKTLDVDQMSRLLNIDDDSWLARRDHAMFELFYSSGLRLSELAGLDLSAIDLTEGLVRVTGKGGKVRVLPVGKTAIAVLQQWLRVRAENLPEGSVQPALFINQKGLRLGVRAIQLRLKHYSLKQGMDEPVHPHMLRHAFASHMLESSGDLRAVQELLGHASISTTQIYTHLDFQHLATVYDAAHPRAHKRARNDHAE